MIDKTRCFGHSSALYADYHDQEWGIPVHEDQQLFEMLILEGAQAGLSWEIILKRRETYRQAFHRFDPMRVSQMTDLDLEQLLEDRGIIRNRLKIFSVRKNACVFLAIQKEWGSFDRYLWTFVNHQPIINHWQSFAEVPCETQQSQQLSRDLKKRGMTFVGSKIIYAYMQAIGLVNDHLTSCFCRQLRKCP